MAYRFLTVLSMILMLAGCASATPDGTQVSAVQKNTGAAQALAPAPLAPYKLQIGDTLAIKFLLNPELNEQVVITPDGMISTAVVQNIQAYGKDVVELRQDLEQYYAEFLIDPKMSVIVQSFAPTRVYVMGEVNSPGEYLSVGSNMTLLQAIAQAGDLKMSARSDEIILLRRYGLNKPQAYVANYKAAASGADPMSDIILANHDVIYVPRTGVANVYKTYNQYIQQFVPPSFGFNYRIDDNEN